jgi:anti-sigma factor RsiW
MDGFLARLRFRRDHRWAPGRMSAYLDGELPEPRRRRMEEHLAECDECRRLIAGLRVVIGALHHLPVLEPGADPAQLAVAVRGRLSGNQPPAG